MPKTFHDVAMLIADRVVRPNPIVAAVIADDMGLNNDTPVVTVTSGDALRRAVYLPPHAPQAGGQVFVCRAGPELTAPYVVVASNFQVVGSTDGDWGTGTRPYGTGSGTWGA